MAEMEQVYQAYFQDVYRYALKLCRAAPLAEDITSDTFLKAMERIHSFRGDCELRVWLCQIAKNCYLDHLRKTQRLVGEDALSQLPDPQDIADALATADEAMAAHRALHRLKEPYREVFSLRVMGGLRFEQIGELFEKSANWACVTYHRARMKLREEMEDT